MDTKALLARARANLSEAKFAEPYHSDNNSAPSLRLFISLYLKSRHDCYIDYMAGAKVLLTWLCTSVNKEGIKTKTPLRIPILTNVVPSYIKAFFTSYEVNELASIIAKHNGKEFNIEYNINLHYAILNTVLDILYKETEGNRS